MGFVWSGPAASKDNDMNKWGGNISWGGGAKTAFGEGFYGMFFPLVRLPPPFTAL